MPIHLVPLPPDHVEAAVGVWLPFIERIAKREPCDPVVLADQVFSGLVHIALAWDSEEKRALALAGMRFMLRWQSIIAEIIWLTGEGRELWQPLLPELERYLIEHQRCSGIKVVCRPGWSKSLQLTGYRTTHVVMEKDFTK